MSTDFTGSNTEKIDKLLGTIVTLRTTLRICFAVIEIGFSLMIGMRAFLVAQSFSTSAKVDRLGDQIAVVRSEYVRLAERLDWLERPVQA